MPASKGINPAEIRREIIDRALLLRVGLKTVAIIKARTLEGIFLAGSSPGSERYSTTPMPLPLAKLQKVNQARVYQMLKEGEDVRVWKSKAGRVWVTLKGGYQEFRELSGRDADRVNLVWSGATIRALNVIGVDEKGGSVTIGFTDLRAAEIAGFHHQGAGRGRVKRIFVALSESELETVGNLVKFTE